MEKWFRFVTAHPVAFTLIFISLAALGWPLRTLVRVNYDVRDYLPRDAPSTKALQAMGEEFGPIPNTRVMIRRVTVPEALAMKERLRSCDGVEDVTWLDDVADVYQPPSFWDADEASAYYVFDVPENAGTGTALFSVTVSNGMGVEAMASIRGVIDGNGTGNGAIGGEAALTAAATLGTLQETRWITIATALFVAAVLFVTTKSVTETLAILSGLGVAAVLGDASNILFGEVSFVTHAAGGVLLLAVSLDYSVFLMNRYRTFRQNQLPDPKSSTQAISPQEAMARALMAAFPSVLSSGATTVIGFLALLFMRFGIGPDLGRAMAKGVAISLLTTFMFLPSVTLVLERVKLHSAQLSKHRRSGGFGAFVSRACIPLSLVFAALAVPALLASSANTFYYGSSHIFGKGTQAGDDAAAIEEVFGKSDTYALLVPAGNPARERALSDSLHSLPQVASVISYVDNVGGEIPAGFPDPAALSPISTPSHSRFIIRTRSDYEGEETFALVRQIRSIAARYYPPPASGVAIRAYSSPKGAAPKVGTRPNIAAKNHDRGAKDLPTPHPASDPLAASGYLLAGEGVSAYDLMDTITADTLRINLVAVGSVVLVLAVTLRSILLPIVMVLVIETAIWLNLSIPFVLGTPVFYISYLIVTSIQLGATVDYAILFTERYRDILKEIRRKAPCAGDPGETAADLGAASNPCLAAAARTGSARPQASATHHPRLAAVARTGGARPQASATHNPSLAAVARTGSARPQVSATHNPRLTAVARTVDAVTGSMSVSAVVLTAVGFLMGTLSSHGILSQLGYFLGCGALLSMAGTLFFLPGMLVLLDRLPGTASRHHRA
ncbi:MAG: MMPL family transporter [Lachnospiraceae bacterium]|jgi:predicted RND superfamily exporter protein|nr:MMPL family transporter [Lachnospiraceae bacterium]